MGTSRAFCHSLFGKLKPKPRPGIGGAPGAPAAAKLPETPEEIDAAFTAMAEAQRGAPEEIMESIQQGPLGGWAPIYSYQLEHVGDLTNRLGYDSKVLRSGSDEAAGKIESAYRSLHHPYGFERELRETLAKGIKFAKKGVAEGSTRPHDVWLSKQTLETAEVELRRLGQTYADAHKQLPVYNEVQRLGNDVAIALGEFRFDDARDIIAKLKAYADEGGEAWLARASRVEPEFARPGAPPRAPGAPAAARGFKVHEKTVKGWGGFEYEPGSRSRPASTTLRTAAVSNDGAKATAHIDEAFDGTTYGGPDLTGEHVGFISNLFVAPEMRRQGFALDLINSTIEELRRRGVRRVVVFAERASREGPGGIPVFKRAGFTETGAENRSGDRWMELDLTKRPVPAPGAPAAGVVETATDASVAGAKTPADVKVAQSMWEKMGVLSLISSVSRCFSAATR